MWLLRWPRNTCTTKSCNDTSSGAVASTAAATTTRRASTVRTPEGKKNGTLSCCCACLARIARKVKKQSKEMVRGAGASRHQSSFHCRYDPFSYSLNFDRSGCGSADCAVDDEDYCQFYAFYSRFVANPRRPACSPNMLPVAAAASHIHST